MAELEVELRKEEIELLVDVLLVLNAARVVLTVDLVEVVEARELALVVVDVDEDAPGLLAIVVDGSGIEAATGNTNEDTPVLRTFDCVDTEIEDAVGAINEAVPILVAFIANGKIEELVIEVVRFVARASRLPSALQKSGQKSENALKPG